MLCNTFVFCVYTILLKQLNVIDEGNTDLNHFIEWLAVDENEPGFEINTTDNIVTNSIEKKRVDQNKYEIINLLDNEVYEVIEVDYADDEI